MRLAVSNLAWPAAYAAEAYAVLAQAGVQGLEIAPGLLFPHEPDPFRPSASVLARLRADLVAAGLTLCSMQSLLFGVTGAALFGNAGERRAFEDGLLRAIRLAEMLGIPNLVMGSPRNRVRPDTLSETAAQEQAAETFRRLAGAAQAAGCVLAIEPNPAAYGTNFLTTTDAAAAFVRRVDHPAVRLNFDVGALQVNGTFADLGRALAETGDITSHVHLSEANLKPFPGSRETAEAVFSGLHGAGWTGWVSIEMLASADDAIGVLRSSLAATRAAMEAAA